VKVATGEGVVKYVGHTYWIIEQVLPSALPAMQASRQFAGELGFVALNRLHVPVALASMGLLLLLIVAGPAIRLTRAIRRGRESGSRGPPLHGREGGVWWPASLADLMPLAIAVGLAILGNAVVCGVFANPHDRYGARMVSLATFVLLLAGWRLGLREHSPQASPSPRAETLDARKL
jgi:hypothetical protein